MNKNILITDLDKIIAASGSLKKKYLGKEISPFIADILSRRKTTIDNDSNYIQLTENTQEDCKYVISSVVVSGDAVGSVIILSDAKITDLIEKSSNFISKFLGKHLE